MQSSGNVVYSRKGMEVHSRHGLSKPAQKDHGRLPILFFFYSLQRSRKCNKVSKNDFLQGKVDAKRKTGTGLDPNRGLLLDEVDLLLIDVVGCDSPVITSIGVKETWGPEKEETEESLQNPSENSPSPLIFNTPSPSPSAKLAPKRKGPKMALPCTSSTVPDEIGELKKRKLKLEVDHLELMNYKLRIDCYEQEHKLDLPHQINFGDEEEQENDYQ